MPPITFSTELDHTELPNIIRQMAGIVEWSTWKRRIDTLESMLESNPFWRPFLLERYGIEVAFGDLHRHLRKTGRLSHSPRTTEEYRLFSFLAVFSQVHAKLNPRGQKKLAGALRSGLEKEFGLGPLAFEMKIANHLMIRGFEIEFHDLEGNGGCDFIAVSESTEIEVECKYISPDIGRQIPRRSLYDLGGALYSLMKQAVDNSNGGRLIQVTLPDRLTNNKEDQKKITERINAILSGNTNAINDNICVASEQRFNLDDPLFSRNHGRDIFIDDVQNYLKRTFNIESANALLNVRPGRAAVIIWLNSVKPDKVLSKILKNLNDDVKKQFSKTRPAFLCIHFADLTHEQLLNLANTERAGIETGLQRMANILLHKHAHLHTIAMMTDGEVRITREHSNVGIRTSIQATGPSYVYKNSNHPLAEDSSLSRVFI